MKIARHALKVAKDVVQKKVKSRAKHMIKKVERGILDWVICNNEKVRAKYLLKGHAAYLLAGPNSLILRGLYFYKAYYMIKEFNPGWAENALEAGKYNLK